jgi:hypothetical protein
LANDSHTHDLTQLLQPAELKVDLEKAIQGNAAMQSSWDAIHDWSVTSRYERKSLTEATDLLEAIEDQEGGLLPWIRLHW